MTVNEFNNLKDINFIKIYNSMLSENALYTDGDVLRVGGKTFEDYKGIMDVYKVTNATFIVVAKSKYRGFRSAHCGAWLTVVDEFDIYKNDKLTIDTYRQIKSAIYDFNEKMEAPELLFSTMLRDRNAHFESSEKHIKVLKK